jgi:CheY-like chemotaxis protein
MRFSRLLSELWLRICRDTHEKVESEQNVRMRTLIFTTALPQTGISVYKELNQAHYDKAITDKHIRSLARDTGLISREPLIETGGPSAVTKATKVVMTSPIKKKNMDKLRRIIIVDDEHDVTFLFKIILEGMNQELSFCCKVDSFNDSLIALENYREGLYDLIIIDVVMPKMDGFRLYKEIRKKDKKVKVCFLTAGEMYYEEYRKHVFPEISADWVIWKPISNDDLVRKVNGYLEI